MSNVLTPRDFRAMHRDALASLPDRAVNEAVAAVEKDGLILRHRMPEAVDLARRFAAYGAAGASPETSEPSASSILATLDADAVLASDRVADAVREEVREFRAELFDQPEAPFSWEEAVHWIETEASAGRADGDSRRRLHRRLSESLPGLEEEARAEHLRLEAQVSAVLLPYVRPGEDTVVNVGLRASYWRLSDTVSSIADRTGFSPALVTLWILAGLRPVQPRARVRFVSSLPGSHRVEITMYSPAVTREEVYELVKEGRELFQPLTRNKATPRDQEFVEIVRSTPGKVPDGEGAVAFWTRVLAECRIRESQPDYEGSGWRGPYNRWNRLVERGIVADQEDSD